MHKIIEIRRAVQKLWPIAQEEVWRAKYSPKMEKIVIFLPKWPKIWTGSAFYWLSLISKFLKIFNSFRPIFGKNKKPFFAD